MRYIVTTIVADTTSAKADAAPPINLAVVIDDSVSMSGEKLLCAKQAAVGIATLMRDKDRLTVVSFASARMCPDAASPGSKQQQELILGNSWPPARKLGEY